MDTKDSGHDDKQKRRLPLVKEPEVAREEDVDRPPWHWSAFGVVAVFVTWLPLAMAVNALAGSVLRGSDSDDGPPVTLVAVNALAFGVAASAGGFLVTRFGSGTGRKEAVVAGLGAAVLAWGIAAYGAPLRLLVVLLAALVPLVAIGAGGGWLGGVLGVRLRGRG